MGIEEEQAAPTQPQGGKRAARKKAAAADKAAAESAANSIAASPIAPSPGALATSSRPDAPSLGSVAEIDVEAQLEQEPRVKVATPAPKGGKRAARKKAAAQAAHSATLPSQNKPLEKDKDPG